MLHHVSFGTNNLVRARAFYDPVLATLGLRLLESDEQSLDYGCSDLIFSLEVPTDGRAATAGNGVHIAFQARNRSIVAAFHSTGLRQGGRDAGAPGLRPQYDANYYAAFLYDPDGNKIEAVTYAAS